MVHAGQKKEKAVPWCCLSVCGVLQNDDLFILTSFISKYPNILTPLTGLNATSGAAASNLKSLISKEIIYSGLARLLLRRPPHHQCSLVFILILLLLCSFILHPQSPNNRLLQQEDNLHHLSYQRF